MWMTSRQAADTLGISTRAMRNKQHLYKTKEVHTGKGRGGKTLYFWIDEKCSNILENTKGTKELLGEISKEPTKGTKEPEANKLINQSDKPTKGTKGTDGVTFSNSSQHAGNNTDTEMCHPTVTNGVTNQRNKGTNDKAFNIAGLDDSPEFIDIESAVTLEGVGRTAIVNRIQRGNWTTIEKPIPSGGKKLYIPIGYFSPTVQSEWKRMQMERSCTGLPAVIVEEQKSFQALTQDQREKAIVRQKLVLAYREAVQWGKSKKIKVKQIDKKFVKDAPVEHHQLYASLGVDRISIQSIRNWDKKLRDAGDAVFPVCLADTRKQNSGRPKTEGFEELEREIYITLKVDPLYKASDLFTTLQRKFPGMPLSYRTIVNLVKEIKADQFGNALVRGRDSEGYRNIRPRVHRLKDIRPGEFVEVDGKTMNNLVYSPFYAHKNPSSRFLIRPTAMIYRDVASGLILSCVLDASENQHVNITAWRTAITRYGIPDNVISDNAGSLNNPTTNTLWWMKKKTPGGEQARMLHAEGWNGLYEEFGCVPHYTHHGNQMSKNIEPAMSLFDRFERHNSVWTGRNPGEREELFQMTNMKLIDTYGHIIMNWEDYQRNLMLFIEEYNNTPRNCLERMDGTKMTPLEAWNEYSHRQADPASVEAKLVLRFPKPAKVRQGEILCNHMYYSHPDFGMLNDCDVQVYYDERDHEQVRIGTIEGQLLEDPGIITRPSAYNDKDKFVAALKQRARIEKAQGRRYIEKNEGKLMDIAELSEFKIEDTVRHLLEDQSESQEADKKYRFGSMEAVIQAQKEIGKQLTKERQESPYLRQSRKVQGL